MNWPDVPTFDRAAFIAAAVGEAELDFVIGSVHYVNVFTGETYVADIGISQGRIAHVTCPGEEALNGRERVDRSGHWAIPGLIDTHVHIESSMVTPFEYARAVLPRGTTTVLIDPHEVGNVAGLIGVRFMLDNSADIPLRVLVMAPSCVPSAPGVENAGAIFDTAEIREMLGWPRVVGLAEVMDYPGVLQGSARMMRLIEATRAVGGLIQGHAPTLTGRRLSAYMGAGIDSDHENRTAEDALAKLRTGMYLEVRESSLSQNAAAMAEALRGLGYLPNVTLCTDDVTPEDLLTQGHVDRVARRLVEEGLDPVDVVRFATLNAANRLRRQDIGALVPGRIADIALLADLPTFKVSEVFRAGRLVASGGAIGRTDPAASQQVPVPEGLRHTVRPAPGLTEDSFRIRPTSPPPDGIVKVRVIDWHPRGRKKSSWGELEVAASGGEIQLPQGDRSLNQVAVVERHGGHGGVSNAIVRDFGLRAGALGSTVSHDSHQLTLVGCDREDMLVAANRLVAMQGGFVLVLDGQVLAEVPLPVCGLISTLPVGQVAEAVAKFRQAVTSVGLPADNTFMQMVSLTLVVSPDAKVSDLGLVDVNSQRLVEMVL